MYTILISESFLLEGIEHVRNLYKSWAQNKSGNPEAAMAIMDDVLKYQQMLPRKDFAKYSSYDELKRDYDQITLKLRQKEISSDVEKVYEDKDLLVIVPKTWQASCKYGSKTKWCTTARDTSKYWEQHRSEGLETFWIYKNLPDSDPSYKWSHLLRFGAENDNDVWCDALNDCYPDFKNVLPKQHPKYQQIIDRLDEKLKFHKRDQGILRATVTLVERIFALPFEKLMKSSDFQKSFNRFVVSWVDQLKGAYLSQEKLGSCENDRTRPQVDLLSVINRFLKDMDYDYAEIKKIMLSVDRLEKGLYWPHNITNIAYLMKMNALSLNTELLKELMIPIWDELNVSTDSNYRFNYSELLRKVEGNTTRIFNHENFKKLLSYIDTINFKNLPITDGWPNFERFLISGMIHHIYSQRKKTS